MGIPAFFRWLTLRYPKIILPCTEFTDISIDNLYLDMNCIIHPCTHPSNFPQPLDEAQMFNNIFEYVDRIVSLVKPKQMLFIAIDGTAPRAKLNQQRSRRFRAVLEEFDEGKEVNNSEEKFDRNCITPGTEFMERLQKCLKYYITERLQYHHLWKNLKVVYSDSNVPGEGEHKILAFIRSQRSSEGYDPYQSHCIYGSDADLIMLCLTLHEERICIVREIFVQPNKQKCINCGAFGHVFSECSQSRNEIEENLVDQIAFQYVKINVLREYLEYELEVNDGIHNDIERKIDDFVFLCFFIGNDFLPHLPSFRIRNGAIDLILLIYKSVLPEMNGYLIQKCKDSSDELDKDEFYINMNINILLSKLALVEEELYQCESSNVESNINTNRFNKNEINKENKFGRQICATKNKIDFSDGNWRLKYYQSKFHIEEDDMKDFMK